MGYACAEAVKVVDQKMVQAQRRADEAADRIADLERQRRPGGPHGSSRDRVAAAIVRAREARERYACALDASARAHERASLQFLACATREVGRAAEFKARAREHVRLAGLDRERAERVRER